MATKHKLLLRCSHYHCSCLPWYSLWQSFTKCSEHLVVIVGTRYVIPINEVTEVAKSVWINRPLLWLQQGRKPFMDLHLQRLKQWGLLHATKTVTVLSSSHAIYTYVLSAFWSYSWRKKLLFTEEWCITSIQTYTYIHMYVRLRTYSVYLVNVGLTRACPNKQTACARMFNAHLSLACVLVTSVFSW